MLLRVPAQGASLGQTGHRFTHGDTLLGVPIQGCGRNNYCNQGVGLVFGGKVKCHRNLKVKCHRNLSKVTIHNERAAHPTSHIGFKINNSQQQD
jgi:hypothetical protein